MKKLISLTIAFLMVLALFTGCRQKKEDEDNPPKDDSYGVTLKGSDAAKLLLAQERLDSQLLKNDGDIFENGVEVFRNLATIAKDNLVKYTFEGNGDQLMNLSFNADYMLPLASNVMESSDGSKLEINGELYQWSDFAEYSNSYDYFTNLTNNVIFTAETAAKQIDDTKRLVRVVDKWVDVGGIQYYLHVEDNCEILYERNGEFLNICRRTRDEQGVNVYEIYISSSSAETRMTYIQGRKYEYTHRQGDFNHNFIAENTKGFWEVLDVGGMDAHYNVSCMVIKDNICYDAFYDPSRNTQGVSLLKVISADKKTDLMFFSNNGGYVELMLQGFDGVEKLQLLAPDDKVTENLEMTFGSSVVCLEQYGKRYYFTTGEESAEVVLENGMRLREGDEYLDGRVYVGCARVSFFNKEGGICGYSPSLTLTINGDSYEERMQILNEFMELTGLSCRRDMDYVQAGILQAYAELEQFVQFHQWNESPITTEEDIAKGFENLDAKYKAWRDLYATVKDVEVIDFNDESAMELNIHFAPVARQSVVSAKNEGRRISVEGIELVIEDTALFVEGDTYMVNFALLGESGLVHFEVIGNNSVAYDGAKSFSASQSATFEIPTLTPDEYTVVAYISTLDGIRMSGYIPVTFTDISEFEEKQGNILLKMSAGSRKELEILCQQILDVEVEVSFDAADVYYGDMYSALSKAAYQYGYAAEGAKIEQLSAENTWIALTDDGVALGNGTYRLKYEIKNGADVTEGYVLTEYAK